MIQENELRVGNLFYPIDRSNKVHLPIEIVPFKVCAIRNKIEAIPYDKIPAQFEKWDEFNLYDLSPIKLTEEILLKCGFEKDNRIDLGELNPCFTIFSFSLMIRHNSYYVDWIGGNTEMKYLHELQNLYFALTKEELQININ